MKSRKHVNLFVPDTPAGAICSSVIQEWADGKYDSVTTVYCTDRSVEQKIHDLVRNIRIAEKEGANPCQERKIIVVGFNISMACWHELRTLKNTSCNIHDSWMFAWEISTKIMKRYFGFSKRKWLFGYRSMYAAIDGGIFGSFDWSPLWRLFNSLKADEFEKCLTAYLHDLPVNSAFNAYDMTDYYFDVFTERKLNDSSKNGCV